MQTDKNWKITEQEWVAAEAYLKNQPNGTKFDRKESNLRMSFIKIDEEIYALSNKQFFDPLGEGAFGKVKLIEAKNGERYAVKIEGRDIRGDNDAEIMIGKMVGLVKTETVRKLGQSRQFKGKLTDQRLYTLMQLKKGENLQSNLDKSNLSDVQKLLIALKALESIQKLHDLGIIHADIKPENFMINKEGKQIVLESIDFGFSMLKEKGLEFVLASGKGTLAYSAPEIYENENLACYSTASDTFALGHMLEVDLDLWLDLEPDLCTDMQHKNPLERPTLIKAMQSLVQELENQPGLDTESTKIITHMKSFIKDHENLSQENHSTLKQQYPVALKAMQANDISLYSGDINKTNESRKPR